MKYNPLQLFALAVFSFFAGLAMLIFGAMLEVSLLQALFTSSVTAGAVFCALGSWMRR
jgi:hypothetical protein